MFKHLMHTIAALALTAGLACDGSGAADIDERYWEPWEIQIEADVKSPVAAKSLLDCFLSAPHEATLHYHDGELEYPDDTKSIVLTLETRAHEDVGVCLRELLLQKFKGEVLP